MDQSLLQSLLRYDPESGNFYWLCRTARCVWIGKQAGCKERNGYIRIRISGRNYSAHRLVWLYVHGHWPDGELDHADGNKDNNCIANLRPATRTQNLANRGIYRNNSSGFKGVSWYKRERRWAAEISVSGKKTFIGFFDSAEEAARAYAKVASERFGEFTRLT